MGERGTLWNNTIHPSSLSVSGDKLNSQAGGWQCASSAEYYDDEKEVAVPT